MFYSWPWGGGWPLWPTVGRKSCALLQLDWGRGSSESQKDREKASFGDLWSEPLLSEPWSPQLRMCTSEGSGCPPTLGESEKGCQIHWGSTRQAGICNSITCEQRDQWHNRVLCLHFLLSLPSHLLSSLGSWWKAHIEIWDCSLSQQISKEGCRVLPRKKHKIHLGTSWQDGFVDKNTLGQV